MATTTVGPISALQINNVFYVSAEAFTTIQAAVNYANTRNAGVGHVVIVQGTYTEPINTVVNGTIGIFITDRRNAIAQDYVWSGSGFVPADFIQMRGLITTGLPAYFPDGCASLTFDPNGTGGSGSGDLRVNGNAGKGMPGLNIMGQVGIDGSPVWVFMRFDADANGTPRILVPVDFITQNLFSLGAPGQGNIRNLPGEMFLNAAPGDGIHLILESGGYVDFGDGQGNMIAHFGNSGPGVAAITFEGDLAVSRTLSATSADITSLAAAAAAIGTLTLAQDPTQPEEAATKNYVDEAIAESGNFVYPDAGVAVSTGTAWGTSINPAKIPLLDASGNQAIPGALGVAGNIPGGTINTPTTGIYFAYNLSGGNGEGDIVSCGGGGVRWYASTPGKVLNSSTPYSMFLAANGDLYVSGTLYAAIGANVGNLTAAAAHVTGAISAASASITGAISAAGNISAHAGLSITGYDPAGPKPGTISVAYNGGGFADCVGPDAATVPDLRFRLYASDNSQLANPLRLSSGGADVGGYLNCTDTLTVGAGTAPPLLRVGGEALKSDTSSPSIISASGTLQLSPAAGQGLYLNVYAGNYIYFCDAGGSGVYHALMTSLGAFSCASLDVSGAKNFKIPHPHDPEKKWLTHSSLEGPEVAVFYRGEGVTKGGTATITLPDYFEALTLGQGRTVQLTQIIDGDDDDFAQLMAGRVVDGKFKVRSSSAAAKFCWEVKAVRADVSIEVVSDRKADEPVLAGQEPAAKKWKERSRA